MATPKTNGSFDVAIIGGGIIGMHCALEWLGRRPDGSIALFEKSRVGHGCTAHAAAICGPLYRTPLHREMSSEGRAWYESTSVALDSAMWKLDVVMVVSRANAGRLQEACENQLTGVDDGVRERVCRIVRLGDSEVLYAAGSVACADPLPLTLALRDAAEDRGLLVYEGTEICRRRATEDGWELSARDGRTFRAERVIDARGPWVHEGNDNLQIRNKRVVGFHIRDQIQEPMPLVHFFDDAAFLMPQPKRRRWFLSVTSTRWNCDPTSEATVIQEEDRRAACDVLSKHCPELEQALMGGAAFTDAYGASGPVACRVDSRGTYVVAGGGGGSGVRYGPSIARRTVDLMLADPARG